MKFPYFAFILTDFDLSTLPGGQKQNFERNLLANSGQISSNDSNPGLLFFVDGRRINSTKEMQIGYSQMNPQKVIKMEDKIKTAPDYTTTRAHQSHLLDKALIDKLKNKVALDNTGQSE